MVCALATLWPYPAVVPKMVLLMLPPYVRLLSKLFSIERMRTTMQGTVRGLKQGFGLGLGTILGGILYSNLGARMCFTASAALPAVSFLLLVIPPYITRRESPWEELAIEKGLSGWESMRSPRVRQRECG